MSKLVKNCSRDPLNLRKYYKSSNPDLHDIDIDKACKPVDDNFGLSLYLNNKEMYVEPGPWSRENMDYLITTVTRKAGGFKRLGKLKYCQPIIVGSDVARVKYRIDEPLTVWHIFDLEPFTRDHHVPYGYNNTLRKTPKYLRWANEVKSGITHCESCGERGYIFEAHHDPELDALLKMYRIKCTDKNHNLCFRDAYGCKGLWDVKLGSAICHRCHAKVHDWLDASTPSASILRYSYEPNNWISNDTSNRWHTKSTDLWNIRESAKTVYTR